MNKSATAPLEKHELHIDNAVHGRRKYVGCKLQKCVPGGSATGGLSDVASGIWYAPAHTYNSAPGKVILDQSVEALPVRCSGIRDRPAATCKSCGRRSVATAEDALVTSYIGVSRAFPNWGFGSLFTWSIYGILQPMLQLHSN
jgi:hypothetical protein